MPTLTSEEARALARRRHSVDAYIDSIVKRWPELTQQQKARLAALLRPTDSGKAAA